VTKGALAPLTAKWGVDATMPEGSDPAEYEAITYPFAEAEATAKALAETSVTAPEPLAAAIAAYLAEPRYFYDVLSKFDTVPQRTIVRAWALLREAGRLGREDRTGRYIIRN
jgi:2,5-furandicarboxylate decarboxylase 1